MGVLESRILINILYHLGLVISIGVKHISLEVVASPSELDYLFIFSYPSVMAAGFVSSMHPTS